MEHKPLISIITVCYNSEKTIRGTLDSVLNQTYSNFEYIIVDGKSTDNTLQIIDSYKCKFGNKVTIISEKDCGIYDAMNKGIKNCIGDIIGFINADDWYECDALDNIAKVYSPEKFEVIYGMQREYMGNIERICYLKKHDFLPTQMIGFPSTFIPRKLYEKYGVYDIKYRSSADYDFMLKLFFSNEVVFKPVYIPISNFRLGGMSGTNIGTIETAQIRYKNGIISKCEKNRVLLIQNCKIKIKNILKFWDRNNKGR